MTKPVGPRPAKAASFYLLLQLIDKPPCILLGAEEWRNIARSPELHMTETYSNSSDVCAKFYDLVIDPRQVANFVLSKVAGYRPGNCLFVGGFFLVARELQELGLTMTLVDYSEDMMREAYERLSNATTEVADLRKLPFEDEFDTVFVIGRVFTHMLTPEDASSALRSIHRSLKPGGVVFLDNYEDTKIQDTDYFNGRISVSDPAVEIVRDSSTCLVSRDPLIVNWKASYHIKSNGDSRSFSDEMYHRAFSRSEMQRLFEQHGFQVFSQGDNFDETSFFTVAGK